MKPRCRSARVAQLQPGDFYELLPETDIHRVRTTSPETSVSLHLLGIDNGCIWRHRFLPEEGKVLPFKSGYVNVPCEGDGVRGDRVSEWASHHCPGYTRPPPRPITPSIPAP